MHIRFFAIEDDLAALMTLAHQQSLVVVPATIDIDAPPVPRAAHDYDVGEDPFCLLPKELAADDVVYVQGTKGRAHTATVDVEASPVIYVSPPARWGHKLDGGVLQIAEERNDARQALVDRRYEVLSHTIRRWARTEKDQGHVGPAARALVAAGKITLGLGKKSIRVL